MQISLYQGISSPGLCALERLGQDLTDPISILQLHKMSYLFGMSEILKIQMKIKNELNGPKHTS